MTTLMRDVTVYGGIEVSESFTGTIENCRFIIPSPRQVTLREIGRFVWAWIRRRSLYLDYTPRPALTVRRASGASADGRIEVSGNTFEAAWTGV